MNGDGDEFYYTMDEEAVQRRPDPHDDPLSWDDEDEVEYYNDTVMYNDIPMYDDNFGFYDDPDDPDTRRFFEETQHNSVLKKCDGCGKTKTLLRHYRYCNSCMTRLERGEDIG